MARVLKEMPEGRRSTYPWDDWTDGQIWELEAGVDFNGKPQSVRAQAFGEAKKRGLKVRTAKTSSGLAIQFYKP